MREHDLKQLLENKELLNSKINEFLTKKTQSTPKQMSFMDYMTHIDLRRCINRLEEQGMTVSDSHIREAISKLANNEQAKEGKMTAETRTVLEELGSYLSSQPQYELMLQDVKNLQTDLSTIVGAVVRHDIKGLSTSISTSAATLLMLHKKMPAEERYFAVQTKKVMNLFIEDLTKGDPTSDDLATRARAVEFYATAMNEQYKSRPDDSIPKKLATMAYESSNCLSAIFSDKKVTAGELAKQLYSLIVSEEKRGAFNIIGDGASEIIEKRAIGLALTQLITNYNAHGAGELVINMYNKNGKLHIEAENDGHLRFDDPNSIFERGVTTRTGEGGTGLYLMKENAEYNGGSTYAKNFDDRVRIGFSMKVPKADELT